MRLTLVASKPTDSVTFGFLPAAAKLGLDVVLVTDQPAQQQRALARARLTPRPGCAPPDAGQLDSGQLDAGQVVVGSNFGDVGDGEELDWARVGHGRRV